MPEAEAGTLGHVSEQICPNKAVFHTLKILKNYIKIHLLKLKKQWLPILSFEDQKDVDFLFDFFSELENQTTTAP